MSKIYQGEQAFDLQSGRMNNLNTVFNENLEWKDRFKELEHLANIPCMQSSLKDGCVERTVPSNALLGISSSPRNTECTKLEEETLQGGHRYCNPASSADISSTPELGYPITEEKDYLSFQSTEAHKIAETLDIPLTSKNSYDFTRILPLPDDSLKEDLWENAHEFSNDNTFERLNNDNLGACDNPLGTSTSDQANNYSLTERRLAQSDIWSLEDTPQSEKVKETKSLVVQNYVPEKFLAKSDILESNIQVSTSPWNSFLTEPDASDRGDFSWPLRELNSGDSASQFDIPSQMWGKSIESLYINDNKVDAITSACDFNHLPNINTFKYTEFPQDLNSQSSELHDQTKVPDPWTYIQGPSDKSLQTQTAEFSSYKTQEPQTPMETPITCYTTHMTPGYYHPIARQYIEPKKFTNITQDTSVNTQESRNGFKEDESQQHFESKRDEFLEFVDKIILEHPLSNEVLLNKMNQKLLEELQTLGISNEFIKSIDIKTRYRTPVIECDSKMSYTNLVNLAQNNTITPQANSRNYFSLDTIPDELLQPQTLVNSNMIIPISPPEGLFLQESNQNILRAVSRKDLRNGTYNHTQDSGLCNMKQQRMCNLALAQAEYFRTENDIHVRTPQPVTVNNSTQITFPSPLETPTTFSKTSEPSSTTLKIPEKDFCIKSGIPLTQQHDTYFKLETSINNTPLKKPRNVNWTDVIEQQRSMNNQLFGMEY